MTTTVPGPPAAVISAILRASSAHAYDPADPSQRRLACFSTSNTPDLPSLITEVVSLPDYAELDANIAITGWLASQGWGTQGVTTVTAAYTTTPSDAVVLVNASAGPVTVTLGNATQTGWINPGQRVSVIKTDTSGNNVTVTGSSGQQVGGASSQTLTNTVPYLSEVFDGANWQTWAGVSSGGGGGVTSVTAADTSIVVGGTGTAPTVRTGTLDVIAADHPPAAAVAMNSQKLTSLANGTASTDAAAYGQTPAGGNTVTIGQGGTGQATQQAALDALAGAQTSNQVLAGNGTHVTLRALGAADLPAATTGAQGAVILDGTPGDIAASPGTAAAGSVGKAADAGHVHPSPAVLAPAGLTGATVASRYVGATASGAPVSGTFAVGDYVVDRTGSFWVCTAAGTPGTWVHVSGGGGGFSNPMTTLGDLIYGGASGTAARLAGDTSNTRKFLRELSSGGVAAAPVWDTIAAGDVPTLNQNTTGTAAGLSSTLAIGSGGTGQTSQQAALDALAGAVTAAQVLAGNGTHVTLRALAAGDLPTATTSTQGAVTFDATASDIQPAGPSAVAGAIGKAADAGHVHQGLALLATTNATGTSGFAKTNGTPTIISWTAPNDGNMHRVIVNAVQHVTSAETGGAVTVTWTAPDGTTGTSQSLYSGGAGTGSVKAAGVANALIGPNTTVAVAQTSALTAGATTVWAEIYGY